MIFGYLTSGRVGIPDVGIEPPFPRQRLPDVYLLPAENGEGIRKCAEHCICFVVAKLESGSLMQIIGQFGRGYETHCFNHHLHAEPVPQLG